MLLNSTRAELDNATVIMSNRYCIISKVSDRISVIKLSDIGISIEMTDKQWYTFNKYTFYDDINKHRAIFTQK